MFDIFNNLDVVQTLAPDVYDSNEESAVVDRQEYEALNHIVSIGESGDVLSGSTYFELVLEHGDLANGSDMAAVTNPNFVLGTIDTNGIFATVEDPDHDEQVYKVGYVGPKRYTRVSVEFSGTHSNGTPMECFAVLGRSYIRPVE